MSSIRLAMAILVAWTVLFCRSDIAAQHGSERYMVCCAGGTRHRHVLMVKTTAKVDLELLKAH